jgi:ATP-dependent Zn protease
MAPTPESRRRVGSLGRVILLVLIAEWALWALLVSSAGTTRVTVPYRVFNAQVNAHNVITVSAHGPWIEGTFRHAVTRPARRGTTSVYFATRRPTFADDNLLLELEREGVTITAVPASSGTSTFWQLLVWVVPLALVLGFFWQTRRPDDDRAAGEAAPVDDSRQPPTLATAWPHPDTATR